MPSATDRPTTLRKLDTRAARHLADLAAIFDDLRTVLGCCERLVTELAKAPEQQEPVIVEGVWTTAVLAYARCFSTERKGTRLTDEDVTRTRLADDLLESHKALLRLRTHYVDPAVNPREQFTVGAAQDSQGNTSGIAITSTALPALDDLTVRQMGALAYELGQLVDERITSQQETVRTAAAELSRSQLERLPLVRISESDAAE